MSEEYYEEEYDDYSYEQYADVFYEGYDDGLEEGTDDIEVYEDAENDCIDNVDYEQDCQDDHLDSKGLNNHHPHVAHTMLGTVMGYAAAKTVRGNAKQRSLKEKLDLLSDMEREFVYRQVQEKMQSENKQNRFWGFLFIILIIVLCLVCC
jgi:hypothetical protein